MADPKLQIEREVIDVEKRLARIERLVGYLFARVAPEADIAEVGAEPTGGTSGTSPA